MRIKGGIAAHGQAVVSDGKLLVSGFPHVFTHQMDTFESGFVTTATIFMGQQPIGIGSPNPGFMKAAIATGAFIHWSFTNDVNPGDWTLRLRKNEAVVDSATITLTSSGAGGVFSKVVGVWSPQVTFAVGDTYYVVADGPLKDEIFLRAILRFEEI